MPQIGRPRLRGADGLRALAPALCTTMFLLAAAQAPAQASAATTVEGETMTMTSGDGRMQDDSAASGGRTALVWSDGDVSKTVSTSAASDNVVVRARGEMCGGAPRMTVSVDGRQVSATDVTSTSYASYSAGVSLAAGSHSVRVAFVNDYLTSSCDRNLFVDKVTFQDSSSTTPPPGSPPPSDGPLLFNADFSDGFSEYPTQIHPNRISVVSDPVLGSARKVLKFTVYQSDTGPTSNPRAQLETAPNFTEGEDRYFGTSYYFPSNFPTSLPNLDWVTLGSQSYGPPYAGAEPVSLRVQNAVNGSGAELRWQRNGTYNWDIPWQGPKIADLRGRWIDVVQRIKLSSDPNVGFVELWTNTGSGWEQQQLNGRSRLYMRTCDSSNCGGANNSRLALYYSSDIPGPLTVYQGFHRIADATAPGVTWQTVAPNSYGAP